MGNHNTDGKMAEQIAAEYLAEQGLAVLACNFRVRGGEVDLICRDGAYLVFVEVRLRRDGAFGGARDSITYQKQQKIIMAARHYLARLRQDYPCRFDCILMSSLSSEGVEWVRDAFSPTD